MGKIIIDDGSKEYSFENKFGRVFAEFIWNPADTGILTRFDEVVDAINKFSFTENASEEDNAKDIVKLDALIREQTKYLLNLTDEGGVFNLYQPCTLFSNGDFYFEVLLEQIQKIIESELGERTKKKLAKIKKVTSKYHK